MPFKYAESGRLKYLFKSWFVRHLRPYRPVIVVDKTTAGGKQVIMVQSHTAELATEIIRQSYSQDHNGLQTSCRFIKQR